MTEETRREIEELRRGFFSDNKYGPHVLYRADELAKAAYELGEKAGRSEQKDSLSTKLVHEAE